MVRMCIKETATVTVGQVRTKLSSGKIQVGREDEGMIRRGSQNDSRGRGRGRVRGVRGVIYDDGI